MRCGSDWATPARTASCSTRPGRRSTSRRWCRTRSSWCCRSTASCAARSGCRPAPSKEEIESWRWPARPSSAARRRRAGQEGHRGAGPPGQRGGLMTPCTAALVIAAAGGCRCALARLRLPAAPGARTSRSAPSTSTRRRSSPLGNELRAQPRCQRHGAAWSATPRSDRGRRWCWTSLHGAAREDGGRPERVAARCASSSCACGCASGCARRRARN